MLPRRHVIALDELTAEEAADLGPLPRALTAALREVPGCSKTYVALFPEAEGFTHVRFHVVPRSPDLDRSLRGPRVFGLLGGDPPIICPTRLWTRWRPVSGGLSGRAPEHHSEHSVMPLVAGATAQLSPPAGATYSNPMLDLNRLDLEEIADALADQTDYEHRWLINPKTGEIAFWTADAGIDGQTPVDLDELDLVCIDPLPSWIWYQDMADFAEAITDERGGRRLARAIQGKGAFRRFKDELHEEYPELVPAWYAFRDARAKRRAVQWLADNSLIDDDAAERFLAGHPDPSLP